MREGSVKTPLRSKYISHQLEEGHWVSAYAPEDLVRVRGRKSYHNWGDRAPWPTSYSLQAIEMDQIWHKTLKSYRDGDNIMRFPVTSKSASDRPYRVLDIGCGTGSWCLEMSQTWKDAEFWGMDLVPIQPNPAYFRADRTVAERVNWLIATSTNGHSKTSRLTLLICDLVSRQQAENMHNDVCHKVSLGIPEVQFYHVFDEAFRVLKPEGHLEIYERTYQFAAGHSPIPISNPEMAPPKKKHSYTELERLYEEVLTAHTINSSPLSIIASAIVLYDGKNIVQSPVIRGTFPALSFRPERNLDMRDAKLEPWTKKPHADYFIETVTKAIETLSPYERDYRFRMILQSLSTMILESADWLWDEYLTKVVGLNEKHSLFRGLNNATQVPRPAEEVVNHNNGANGTPIQSRRNSLSTNVALNSTSPNANLPLAWSNKDKFDTEVHEWSSDLNRRASPDKFLELIFGWGDGKEEDFCPGGRKLVGAKTWSNERKLECESLDDKLGSWQMCGFRIQKS